MNNKPDLSPNHQNQITKLLCHVVDAMSNYFLAWDQNDRLAVFNKKVFELFPGTHDLYVIGRTFEEILLMSYERGILKVPGEMTIEQWMDHRSELHKRGEYCEVRQIKDRWYQIRDQKIASGYSVTTAIDVSYLKKQEEKLILAKKQAEQATKRANQAESLLRDALETVSEGCSLWDKEDRFILSNKKLFELYPNVKDIYVPGHTYEEILRKGIEKGDFTVPDDKTKEAWIKERAALHKNGNHRYVKRVKNQWLQISDQRTTQGNVVTTAIDVTPLKEEGVLT